MSMTSSGQVLPVRVYHTESRIMLAAPMPGLEPENIAVRIDGDRVTIHGEERGQHQRELALAIAEWSVGPYHREIHLGEPVDGFLTNATYGNGVLVLSMPKVSAGHAGSSAEFRLVTVAGGHGERIGHVGRDVAPQSTEAHWAEKHAGAAGARPVGRGATPYAHVNVWHLNEAGALGARELRTPSCRSGYGSDAPAPGCRAYRCGDCSKRRSHSGEWKKDVCSSWSACSAASGEILAPHTGSVR